MIELSQCVFCKHLIPESQDENRLRCAAFPLGVPPVIAENDFDHTQPYPGDRGIRFEEMDAAPLEDPDAMPR